MCAIKDDNFHLILGQPLHRFSLEAEFNEFLHGLRGEVEVPGITNDELNEREEAIRIAEAKIEEMRQTLNELQDVTEENEQIFKELQLKLDNLRLSSQLKIGQGKIRAMNVGMEMKKKRLEELKLQELEEKIILLHYQIQDNQRKIEEADLQGELLQAQYDLLCSM